jgi:parallel beta-helix repeat protein
MHGNYNVFDRNDFHDNGEYGIHMYGGAQADQSNGNIVRNNRFWNNNQNVSRYGDRNGAGLLLGNGSGNVAYNNILWGNDTAIEVAYGGANNTYVYNNTVYGNAGAAINISAADNTVMTNNLLFGNLTAILDNDNNPTTTGSNNLCDSGGVGCSLISDPLFANVSMSDFHLQAGSPAIDSGFNLAGIVPADFDGVPRPQGSAYDVGAYEYRR